jgi:hypothetical protein
MTLTLVDMTHEDLPGVVKTTSINAYRYGGYYEEGWRSADDPEWTGQGSEAPNPHVGDNTLHGGGIEIAYAQRTTNSSALAVSAITMAAVPSLVVTVPALLRPIYLLGQVHLTHSVASATAAAIFAPVGETSVLNARGPGYTTHRATADFATSYPFHRIAAGAAETQWQVFVTAPTTGNVTCIASSIAPSSIRAVPA